MISRRSLSVSNRRSEPTPAKPASAHGGRGVTVSIRGRDPRGSGSNPAGRPSAKKSGPQRGHDDFPAFDSM